MKCSENMTKQPKLTDKAFMHSIAVSIFSIILCLIALCSVTWAWFDDSVSSASNNIRASSCDVSVEVTEDGTLQTAVSGKYILKKDKKYTITIKAEGEARSAYCIFTIGGTQYYTEQISTSAPDNVMTFTLTFTEDTDVEIATGWGSSSKENRAFATNKQYLDLNEIQATAP